MLNSRTEFCEIVALLLPRTITSGRSRDRPRVCFTDDYAAYLTLKSSCHHCKLENPVVPILIKPAKAAHDICCCYAFAWAQVGSQ
jgi:hypothetical protein